MTQRLASRFVLAFVVASMAAIALAAAAPSALAQVPDPYASGTPTVLPTLITQTGSPSPDASGTPTVSPTLITQTVSPSADASESPTVLPNIISTGDGPGVGGGVLPLTGGNLMIFFVLAAGLIGIGTLLTLRFQRKRSEKA